MNKRQRLANPRIPSRVRNIRDQARSEQARAAPPQGTPASAAGVQQPRPAASRHVAMAITSRRLAPSRKVNRHQRHLELGRRCARVRWRISRKGQDSTMPPN